MGKSRKEDMDIEDEVVVKKKGKRKIVYPEDRDYYLEIGNSRKEDINIEDEVLSKKKGKRKLIYVDDRDYNSASPKDKRHVSGKRGKKHGKGKVRYVHASDESESDSEDIVVKRRSKHKVVRKSHNVSDSEGDDSGSYDVGVKRKKRSNTEYETDTTTQTDDSADDAVDVKKRNKKKGGRNAEVRSEKNASRRQRVSDRNRNISNCDKRKKTVKDNGSSEDDLRRRKLLRPNNCFGAVTFIDKDTYYRSNIQGAMCRINTLEFGEEHLLAIKRTPFWCLFDAIYKKDSDKIQKRCHKYEDDIRQIVDTFDIDTEKFVIGGKLLPLTSKDADLIFGIARGDVEIVLKKDHYEAPDWLKRCFGSRINDKKVKFVLYRNLIFEKLKELLDSTENETIEDCARLVHCYLLASIFTPLQNGSIAWQLSCFLKEFGKICNYNWSEFVVRMLKSQLKRSLTMKAGGCAIILPFWLCEHTQLVKRDSEVAFPRILNWNMGELHKVLQKVKLSRITKVYKSIMDISTNEMEVLLELKMLRDSNNLGKVKSNGDGDDGGNSQGLYVDGDEQMATAPTDNGDGDDEQVSPTKECVENYSGLVSNLSNQSGEGELKISTPLFSLGLTQFWDKQKDFDAIGEVGISEHVLLASEAQDYPESSNMRGSNKTDNCLVDGEHFHEQVAALKLQVGQLKKEIDDERNNFGATVKSNEDLISQLRSENTELVRRLAVFEEGPSATQLYESQAVMAQLDATEKLAIMKQEKDEMMKLISDLTRQLMKRVSPTEEVAVHDEAADATKGKVTEIGGDGDVQGTALVEDECIERVLETQPGSSVLYDNPANMDRLKESFELISPEKNPVCLNDALAEDTNNEITPGDKGKGIAIQPEPKSMYKRIKVRNDRRKVVTSPQMNTREIVTVQEGYTDEEIARDMKLLKENKKNPFNMTIGAVKKTEVHVREEIAFYYSTKGANHVVFRGVQPLAEVTIENMMKILHNERLNSAVIDAWADLVQKKYSPVSRPAQFTMVFSSLCWELISTSNGPQTSFFEALIEKRFEEAMDMETLVFPILAGGEQNTTRGVGDHWTLLKLHVPKSKWSFYNSIRPRAGGNVDQHLKQSLIVVKYVDKKLREVFKKNRPTNKFLIRPLVFPTSEICVQQAPNSLDCGVVVCNNIEKIMNGKPLLKGDFSMNAAAVYRARMATWFMES